MLEEDPEKRISWQDLYGHQIFSERSSVYNLDAYVVT